MPFLISFPLELPLSRGAGAKRLRGLNEIALLLIHKQKFVRRQAAVRARVAGLHPKGKAVHTGRRAAGTRRTRIVVGMAAVGFAAELRVNLTFRIVAVIVVVRTGCKRSRLACHRIPAVTVRCCCKIAHVLCSCRATSGNRLCRLLHAYALRG